MGGSQLPPQACNLNGFGEAPEVVAINEKILRAAGGSWYEIPADIRHWDDRSTRSSAFYQTLNATQSRFKDPRLVLTFPLWKPFLESYQIIACFRHPMAVPRAGDHA